MKLSFYERAALGTLALLAILLFSADRFLASRHEVFLRVERAAPAP